MRRFPLLFWLLLLCAPVAVAAPDGGDADEAEVEADAPDEPAAAGDEAGGDEAGAEASPADALTGDQAYKLKITELETRVNELKERIFRSKTRLAILKESVLASSIAGAEAQILHRNEMGSSFRLEKVAYSLDGTPIRSLVDQDGDLDGKEEIEILNGPIVPGNHTLSVVMTYRGNGFGIFSYLKGYVFNLRSSHTFRADEGKLVQVKAIGYEKGGITTDLKDRPDIRFEDRLSDVRTAAAAADGERVDAPDAER
ncbi:MAG: dihydrolipoamide acetyltransferase [bacterium]